MVFGQEVVPLARVKGNGTVNNRFPFYMGKSGRILRICVAFHVTTRSATGNSVRVLRRKVKDLRANYQIVVSNGSSGLREEILKHGFS